MLTDKETNLIKEIIMGELRTIKAEEQSQFSSLEIDDDHKTDLINLANKLGCKIDWNTLDPDGM